MRADIPLVKAMEESGMDLDPDTMSRTMGAASDSGIPKTSTTRPMSEIEPQRRIQFVLESLGSSKVDRDTLLNAAVRDLRAQGINQPNIGQVSDLLMSQYQQAADAGTLRRITRGPRRGQQKLLDEEALQSSITKAAGRRPEQEADLARAAASQTQVSETDRRLLSIMEMMDRARTGL